MGAHGAAAQPSWYTPPSDFEPEPSSATVHSRGGAWAPGAGREEHGEHWHKDLFPLDMTDYVGFFSCTLGLILASGGGIGGGGMLVPLYVLVMGFSPKHAIPLSNVTVFGGSIANFYMNRKKRHPSADRPLVDYDLILVMQPMTIAGALLGSLVNKVLPEIVLTVCLVLLLAFTTKQTLEKGFEIFAKESAAFADSKKKKESALTKAAKLDKADGGDGAGDEEALLGEEEEDEAREGGLKQRSSNDSVELGDVLGEEKTVVWWKVGVLWAVFGFIILASLLKGGGGFESPIGITCGSGGYWATTFSMFGWILCVSHLVREYLVKSTAQKQALGYKYEEGDVVWDERATVVYPLICIAAGLCAGMFGIGGGIVQVPLMLQLGVNPKVASATSATMIMYTSFTALTSFYVFGLVIEDYALAGFVMGIAVTAVGQVGITELIKKLGRDSIIIFSVAAVVGVSAVLMGTHSFMAMSSADLSIGHICEADESR